MSILDKTQNVIPYATDSNGDHYQVSYQTTSDSVIMNDSGLKLSESEVEMSYNDYKALEQSGGVNPDVKYIVPDYRIEDSSNIILRIVNNKLNNSIKVFKNVQVLKSSFVTDSTYSDYGYKVDITLNGVTANDVPSVNLAIEQATSGIFSPIAISSTNCVTIFASEKPSSNFVIPNIVCIGGGV